MFSELHGQLDNDIMTLSLEVYAPGFEEKVTKTVKVEKKYICEWDSAITNGPVGMELAGPIFWY